MPFLIFLDKTYNFLFYININDNKKEMGLNKNDEVKEWNCIELYNNTATVYKNFNDIYLKNRESARYYILGKHINSTIIKVFTKKNIKILIKESISYGVSITLKRYKSTKLIYKYYIDTSTGLIAKAKNNKFLQCKPNELDIDTKNYVIGEMPWIKFIFDLNLPVTFNTIITKKLYSTKKLLRWYWNTDYRTALKLNSIKNNDHRYFIRKNLKNIDNINNINSKNFESDTHLQLFINTLTLAVKVTKKINAIWSFNRLFNEYNKFNKIILNKLYENYNYPIRIHDIFKPILNFLLIRGYYIPRDYKDLSKLSNREYVINSIIETSDVESSRYYLIIYKDNKLMIISANKISEITQKYNKFHLVYSYIAYENIDSYKETDIFKIDKHTIDDDIETINKEYDQLLKIYERNEKIKFLKTKIA